MKACLHAWVHADGGIHTIKLALFVVLGFVRFVGESLPSRRRYRLLQLSRAKRKPLGSPRQNIDPRRRNMKPQSPSRIKQIFETISVKLLMMVVLLLFTSCTGQGQKIRNEEIVFYSGAFKIVGDLRLPEGESPHPVVVFVHGDGPNDRTSGGTYPPIMERMERAGYATFAWDKPGTGESTGQIDRSRLGEQRAQILLDAVKVLKARSDIDTEKIGLWGISQAGYVMPRALSMSKDIAFMIAVSCPGAAGVDQGAYLVSAQAVCAGVSEEDAEQMRKLLAAIERVERYDDYVQYKELLDAMPGIGGAVIFSYRIGVVPEEEWHAPNLQGEYFWNPIEVIEQTTIPVLAFFGERDTQVDPIQSAQAYREALERAGNPNFRVELIPGTDHNIILSETGCLGEREKRQRNEWTNYAPEYLDTLEEWLRELNRESE
jgi:pimeloyl-ACP methyl ester carboxylesterase